MKADAALADLAASVADGLPIDWEQIESRVEGNKRRLVRHLRLVDNISALYRTIPAEEEETAEARRDDAPRWGHLVLRERIGEGTSCDVYRAWDSGLHRDVALKLLHDEGATAEAHTRILQEARRLARVRHPHVVQVYGAEEHSGRVGLWMELVTGESLEQVVKTRGPFGPREAAGVGQELCAALAAVHSAGLLHRDVKAQNVLREKGGRIVLMDFGTGEELRSNVGSTRLVGTPLYLAPEIFGGKPASVQSDVYSLGVLLFYLVTGQFPVVAGTMEELAKAHVDGRGRRLRDLRPDLPGAFVRTVERAIERDPSRRYATAGEMEAALEEAAIDRVPITLQERIPVRQSWRRFIPIAVAASLLIAALIVWTRFRVVPAAVQAGSIRTIAVLPLADHSQSPSPWLADALTDQVIATLGEVQALRVISRSSVVQFKGTTSAAGEIAKRLGVDAVVEGTITVDSSAARVNARLIAAGSHTQLWSQTFERPMADALGLQSDIARAVASAVHASVTPAETARLATRRQTLPAAEEAYVQGRLHLAEYGPSGARRALEAFERATRLDAGFGPPHAGAAIAYVRLAAFGAMSMADARQSSLAEARRALEIDDDIPDAHAALGDIEFLYNWDFASAEREYVRSIELNGSFSYARLQYAQLLAAMRRFDDAIVQSGTAVALSPESDEALRTHGIVHYYKRDYAAAEEIFERAAALEANAAATYVDLARVAEDRRDYARALEFATRAASLSNGGGVPLRVTILRLQALGGDTAAARDALRDLQREAAERKVRLSARDIGYAYLAFGEYDRACRAFAQALEDRDPSLIWLTVDPRVDALRDRPDFRAVVEAISRQ